MSDSAEAFIRWALDGSKEEVPGGIDGGMEECRGENRAGVAPGPAVEKACDGGQDHVAPVGKVIVGDVREAKEKGSDPPADEVTLGCSREHILEQAAEEKLFGPGGEKQNSDGKKWERLPLGDLWSKLDEMHALAEWNGNAGKYDEAGQDEEAPMASPTDRIADAVDAANKHEARERDIHAKEHGENVGKTPARVRPEPMR